jgi:hypothetical protein
MVQIVVAVNLNTFSTLCLNDEVTWPASPSVLKTANFIHPRDPTFFNQKMSCPFEVELSAAVEAYDHRHCLGNVRPHLEHLKLPNPVDVTRAPDDSKSLDP